MSVGHYENFPVASVLLPRRLRYPVTVIYRFARSADDFADEGTLPDAERLDLLDGFRAQLGTIGRTGIGERPLFDELARVIALHDLPLQLFHDLLDAFTQDVIKKRYADYAEVLDYCRRSANPVGRLLLHLFDAATPTNLACADAICTSLQLINFLQDVPIDWAMGRVYLPQEDLANFNVTELQIATCDAGEAWQALMRFQVARTRALLISGAPLGSALPGRIGLEIRMIMAGGHAILDKLIASRFDMFRHRPVLKAPDWLGMLYHSTLGIRRDSQ